MLRLFSRKKESEAGGSPDYSVLQTDMHSHLLPGIDDGSPDLETSLDLIRGLMELGYKKFITTPHIMWDMYRNTRDIILSKQELLQKQLDAEGIQTTVHAAAEYFLDDYVESLLQKNEPLLTLSGNLVLVEFSMAHKPMSLKNILFEMQMQGYQPVLAHPERYIYLDRQKEFYDELKDAGCYFQLNLLSVAGYYGKAPLELAQYLLKNKYYDFAGTDLHHGRHLDALSSPLIKPALDKLLEQGRLKNTSL